MSDIDTAVVDSLKVLDLKRPIREADMVLIAPSRCSMKFTFSFGRLLNWLPLETDRDNFVCAAGFAVCSDLV